MHPPRSSTPAGAGASRCGAASVALGVFAACAACGSSAIAVASAFASLGTAGLASAAAATVAASTAATILVAVQELCTQRLGGAVGLLASTLAADLREWDLALPTYGGPTDRSAAGCGDSGGPAPGPAGCCLAPAAWQHLRVVAHLEQLIGLLMVAAKDAQARERSVRQFVACTSHDIRTPLHGIIGLVEVSIPGAAPDTRGLLQQVVREGRRLQVLLNDILDMSRLQAGAMTVVVRPTSLWRPVRECCELFAEHALRGKEVTMDVSNILAGDAGEDVAATATVIADRHRLMQVATNLLSNAFKHARSRVGVRFCCHRRAQVHAALLDQLSQWIGGALGAGDSSVRWPSSEDEEESPFYHIVCIVDDGPGVPPSCVESIWQPFQQADPGRDAPVGAGLGLSICASLMALMGGCVGVTTSFGRGSCFFFGFRHTEEAPVCDTDASLATSCLAERRSSFLQERAPTASPLLKRPREVDSDSRCAHKRTVLVVDDVAVSRLVARRFLERAGLAVIEADSGELCLRLLRELAARGGLPDVLVLDWEMPGLSGIQVAKAIRCDPDEGIRCVPIVCASGHGTAGDGQQAMVAGCDAFLPKPFTGSALYRALAPYLPEAGGSDAGAMYQPGAQSPRSTCTDQGTTSSSRYESSLRLPVTASRRSLAVAEEESIILRAQLSPRMSTVGSGRAPDGRSCLTCTTSGAGSCPHTPQPALLQPGGLFAPGTPQSPGLMPHRLSAVGDTRMLPGIPIEKSVFTGIDRAADNTLQPDQGWRTRPPAPRPRQTVARSERPAQGRAGSLGAALQPFSHGERRSPSQSSAGSPEVSTTCPPAPSTAVSAQSSRSGAQGSGAELCSAHPSSAAQSRSGRGSPLAEERGQTSGPGSGPEGTQAPVVPGSPFQGVRSAQSVMV